MLQPELRNISEFPYFAPLIIKQGFYDIDYPDPFENEDQYICGTTIIGYFWVLTTAHCTDIFKQGLPWSSAVIRTGEDIWQRTDKKPTHFHEHHIKKIVQNENYDEDRLYKDLSVIRVIEPFKEDFERRIPNVAGVNYPYEENSTCTVIGYGPSNVTNMTSATPALLTLNLTISNHQACKDIFHETLDWENLVSSWNFCATPPKDSEGICFFTSGGPLIQNNTLIGIVSFGQVCEKPEYPGVYTKVNLFYRWFIELERKIHEGTGIHFMHYIKKNKYG